MASSGSFNTTGGYQGRVLNFSWSIQSQSIANNTTTISWTLSGAGNAQSSWYTSGNFKVIIDGTQRYFSATRIQLYNGTVVASGTVTLNHNSDGTRSFSASAEAGIYTVAVNSTGSGSWTLDTIPRSSSISSFPSFYIDGSSAITISSASGSFSHNLELKVGSTSICSRTGIGTSYTLSLSTAEQDAIYQLIPNSSAVTVTLYCTTVSGGSAIGTTSTNTTAYVSDSIVPSFTGISFSEGNSAVTSAGIGAYIQNVSKLNISIVGDTGAKYSSISSYTINFDGINYSGKNITTNTIKSSGSSLTITATIIDSRGKPATRTTSVSVLAYSLPTISRFDLSRCNSDGSANEIGTTMKVTISGSVTSLYSGSEKNKLYTRIYSKLRTTSTWTKIWDDLLLGGLSETNVGYTFGTYDATQSYDVRLEVSDIFNTTIAVNILSTGLVTMSWSKNGVGIGKVWQSGALDVGGDVNVDGHLVVKKGADKWSKIDFPAQTNDAGYIGHYESSDLSEMRFVVSDNADSDVFRWGYESGGVFYEGARLYNTGYMFIGNRPVWIGQVGMVAFFAMGSSPASWLFCDGSSLSRTAFPELFNAIGTTFGAIDGSSFSLPDLRGVFIRGWDYYRGLDSGRTFGSYQADELKSHYHSIDIRGGWGGGASDASRWRVDAASPANPWSASIANTGGAETRPKNVALLPCIRYQ